jgi:hypothetical protein
MKHAKGSAIIVASVLALSCPGAFSQSKKLAPMKSALALVAVPNEHSGKVYKITGWLSLAIESKKLREAYLFPTLDHLRVFDLPSAIIVDTEGLSKALKPRNDPRWLARLQGACVIIEGRFTAWDGNGLGVGEITDVVVCDVRYLRPKDN